MEKERKKENLIFSESEHNMYNDWECLVRTLYLCCQEYGAHRVWEVELLKVSLLHVRRGHWGG